MTRAVNVALFVTCLTDQFYPQVGVAVVEVLERLGCRVSFPSRQTCCGQPLWNNGFLAEARRLARRMISVFEQADYVVTPSGSCAATVREAYARMLRDEPEWHARAQRLAGRTFEFVEFLTKVLRVDLRRLGARWEGRVTYHYSCHLRGLGLKEEAVDLLRRIEGLTHAPLEHRSQCCGFGGTFALKYPWISGPLARQKTQCIRATGTPVVVSNEAGCTMSLAGACRREGVDVRFVHVAEILAESLGRPEPTP
jgi:L-lactate dehydrogenase complex protein LldE